MASFALRFALALAIACFAVANDTGEQVTPDSDTPLAPKYENRQLRTELEEMRNTMKATEERHGKEIAKLETLVNANVQSEPRAADADVNARLLPAARPMHYHGQEFADEDPPTPQAIKTILAKPRPSNDLGQSNMPASSGDVKTNTNMP